MQPVWWIIIIFGVLIIIIIILEVPGRKKNEAAWRELAERTGLTYKPRHGFFGIPRLGIVTGTYRGRRLTLDKYTVSSPGGDPDDPGTSTTYTRIALSTNVRYRTMLSLSKKGIFSSIGKIFGAQDVQVGDEVFDQRFVIKSQPEGLASRVFASSDLRRRILQIWRRKIWTRFRLSGRELLFEKVGVERDVEYLYSLIDLLCDLAEAVEKVST